MNRLEFNERYAKSLRLIKKYDNMLDVEKMFNQTKTLINDVTKQGLLSVEDNGIYMRKLDKVASLIIANILMHKGTDE